MTTEGIEAVFLETHNWGKSAKFFQGLGYEIEFATDHNSANCAAATARASSSPRCRSPSQRAGTSCWPWPMRTRLSPMPPSKSPAGGRTRTGAQG